MKFFSLFLIGVLAGSMITVQSVLNAVLGRKTGNFGSVLILTFVSIGVLLILIALFPNTANVRALPSLSEWYLYLGGVLGVVILATPIFLIPRIGVTSTLMGLVIGQLVLALVFDHFGFLNTPKIELNIFRVIGLILLIVGVFLVRR